MSWYLDQYNNALAPGGETMELRKVVPNTKQAVIWIARVWDEMPGRIIENCWRHSGEQVA